MTEQNHEEPQETAQKGETNPTVPPSQASEVAPAVSKSASSEDVTVDEAELIARTAKDAEARFAESNEDGTNNADAGDADDDVMFLDPDDDDVEQEVAIVEPEEVELLRTKVEEVERHLEFAKQAAADAKRETADAKREGASFKERLVRTTADYDNFRKRATREKADLGKYAIEKVVAEFLPVVDNLERAVQHAQTQAEKVGGESAEATSGLIDGVQMVLRQFKSQLERNGVKSFESKSQPFDPEKHEAVQQVASPDHETGQVVEVYQRGYMIHDRLLRPAMVVVAKNPTPPEPEVAPEEPVVEVSEEEPAAPEAQTETETTEPAAPEEAETSA